MKYGCMGSEVNIAGRLESYTIGGQVFITEKTRNLITDDLFIVYEGTFLPKGAPEELRYFQIGGIGDIRISGGLDNEVVWQDAPKKNKYKLYFVEGKTVSDDAHRAAVRLVSQDGRFAEIVTKTPLKDKQNIMLCQGYSRVYAKVIRKEDDGYVICYTSSVQTIKH
jgi:adenylate cyclase